MSKKSPTVVTDLICLDCGNKMTIQRYKNKQKKVGHIKDLYCVNCGKVTKYYEILDKNIFYWYCISNDKLDDNSKRVFDFLWGKDVDNDRQEYGICKKVLTKK